jgi:hypothetical protein
MVSEKFRLLGEISKRLKDRPVLVGGGAVELYSSGAFVTGDIDIIGDKEALISILQELGFKREGMYFTKGNIFFHLLSGPFEARSDVLSLKGTGFTLRVISIEDLIVDRLNACKWWKSAKDCEQAKYLIYVYIDKLDKEYLEERARVEGVIDVLSQYLDELMSRKETRKVRRKKISRS